MNIFVFLSKHFLIQSVKRQEKETHKSDLAKNAFPKCIKDALTEKSILTCSVVVVVVVLYCWFIYHLKLT